MINWDLLAALSIDSQWCSGQAHRGSNFFLFLNFGTGRLTKLIQAYTSDLYKLLVAAKNIFRSDECGPDGAWRDKVNVEHMSQH